MGVEPARPLSDKVRRGPHRGELEAWASLPHLGAEVEEFVKKAGLISLSEFPVPSTPVGTRPPLSGRRSVPREPQFPGS